MLLRYLVAKTRQEVSKRRGLEADPDELRGRCRTQFDQGVEETLGRTSTLPLEAIGGILITPAIRFCDHPGRSLILIVQQPDPVADVRDFPIEVLELGVPEHDDRGDDRKADEDACHHLIVPHGARRTGWSPRG